MKDLKMILLITFCFIGLLVSVYGVVYNLINIIRGL